MSSGTLLFTSFTTPARRWVVVALTISVVAWLAQASLVASGTFKWLGVVAEPAESGLVVRWVQPGGWGWDSGVRPGDRLVRIDGVDVSPATDASALATATRVQVQSSDGHIVDAPMDDAPVPDSDLLRWVFLLTAACFLIVGGAIYVLAVERAAADLMLLHATSGAVLFTAALATPSGVTWALGIEYAGLVTFGTSTVLLCLAFPIDRLRSVTGQRLAVGVLIVNAALIVAYVFAVLVDSAVYDVLRTACFVVFSIEVVGAAALLVAGVRATPASRRTRRQALTLIALAMMAGALPFVLLSLVPYALGLGTIVPPQLAVLSIVLVPASFGIGILSRQFWGIETIVRRSLIALVIWIGLLAVYVFALELVTAPIPMRMDRILLAVVVTAGSFPFLQARARAWLEQLLFPDTYVYADAVQRIGREIVTLRGEEAITARVLHRLGSMLDVSWVALTFDDGGTRYSWGSPTEDASASLVEPLIADGAQIGWLLVGPKRKDVDLRAQDHALVRTLAPLVATAVQSAARERHLETQVRLLHHREEELVALSDRLMRVQEDDRRTLALDLHDDPLQRAILLAREVGEEHDEPRSKRWRREIDEIISSLRAICSGLRPRVLDDLGLDAGLSWLVNDLRARSELDVSLYVEGPEGQPFGRLPAELEIALFRVAQEALANCQRHAEASSVAVELARSEDCVRLIVHDDGVGYRDQPRVDQTATLGVLGMRERLRTWGGNVTIEPLEPRGTRVVAEVGV